MSRNRASRNNPIGAANNKPFVPGGVISNFTAAPVVTAPIIPQTAAAAATNNILINIQETPLPQDTNLADSNMETNQSQPDDEANANGGPKRRFIRQVIPKKLKRLRRNRRLRKILTPKNALMSLHELMGQSLSEYNIMPEERGFVAQVFVNNVQYEGRGNSKMAAKNNASEKALRDIIIQKMIQSPRTVALKANNDATAPPTGDDLFHEDIDMPTGENENDNDDESGEVPMLHLASFALHKLFTEWQAEGFEIPDFKTLSGGQNQMDGITSEKPVKPPALPAGRTTVPENAQTMHPTTLLCMMRPATKYVDLGSDGAAPNILHRVGVEVDNIQFIGVAKNKKLARKYAALEACNQLFGTNFAKDEN